MWLNAGFVEIENWIRQGERYTGGRLSNPNEKVDFLESLLGPSQVKCFLQNILVLE